METGRNWTRRSIEELIDAYFQKHKDEISGDDPSDNLDDMTYTAYNFPSFVIPLVTENGQIWGGPIVQNKELNRKIITDSINYDWFLNPFFGKNNFTLNNVCQKYGFLNSDQAKMETYYETKFGVITKRSCYFAVVAPDIVKNSGFATQSTEQLIATAMPLVHNPTLNRSGWSQEAVLTAFQIDGNNIYNYIYDTPPYPTHYNTSDLYFLAGSGTRINGSGTSAGIGTFRNCPYKYEMCIIGLYSNNFADQAIQLYNATVENGHETIDLHLSTLLITTDQLKKIYPNKTVTEIIYHNDNYKG